MNLLTGVVFLGAGILGSSFADEVLRQEILPSKAESAWLEIDWKTDLWEARKEAAKSDKPIYLWEMDGHPLGCSEIDSGEVRGCCD